MAEQEQPQSATPETSTESSDQTLEQVYKQYNVDQQANEFNPQREQPKEQSQPVMGQEVIPDPVLDQAGFKAYLAKQDTTVKQALAGMTQFQQQLHTQELRRREEADIKSAVSIVKEKIGDIDEDFVEIALGQKARKDPQFMSVYQNRAKNPQAWRAALGAVASEFKGKYQFRQDSQLTENVRAAKQSTQSSLTAKESANTNPIEKRLSETKNDADFGREWERIKNNGF